MSLYELLPSVVKLQDRLASGVTSDAEETTLQKFFYALDQEIDVTEGFIEGLRDLLQPESCPKEYLPLLEYFLGSVWPSSWSEEKQRLVVGALIKLYHHSGQRLSWTSVLNLLGYSGYFPWELWKEDVYEDFDYSLYGPESGNYYYQYHAARVDIRLQDQTYKGLSDAEKALIETFRPIHVLFRTAFLKSEIVNADTAQKLSSQTLSSNAGLGIQESLADVSDAYSIAVSCIATCETSCQVGSSEVGFTGTFVAVYPTTGNPAYVVVGDGVVSSPLSTIIVVTDPATGEPLHLTINGSGYVTDYTGNFVVINPSTGESLHLFVLGGGIGV